jgi:pilus assembly protein CpaB
VNDGKGKVFMVLAVLLAGAAAVVGYYGVTSIAGQAAADNEKNYRTVVVTATDLTFGQKLDRAMLRTARYPKDAVPEGAYSDMDSVVGQTTKVFLGAKEPVTSIKLSSRGGGLSMLVRPTMRAASVQVDAVSGVSGFVLPGDRVDVLVTVDNNRQNEDAITRTILQNIEVLAAGQKTEQRDNKPITVQSVTLLLDPKGAEALAHAGYEGEIHLVLRNPEDQEEVNVAALTTGEMLGRSTAPRAVAVRRGTTPARPAGASKPAPPSKVRIIRDAKVSETPAVSDSVTQ